MPELGLEAKQPSTVDGVRSRSLLTAMRPHKGNNTPQPIDPGARSRGWPHEAGPGRSQPVPESDVTLNLATEQGLYFRSKVTALLFLAHGGCVAGETAYARAVGE